MAICKHCNALIKPLGMPVDLVERMEVELRQIVSDVKYRFSDKPNYPVPVVPLIVEFIKPQSPRWCEIVSIVVWKEPCVLVKVWPYHARAERP